MAIIKGHAEASYLHCVSLRFVANFVSGQAATGRCYPPSSDIQMAWLARGAEVRPNLALKAELLLPIAAALAGLAPVYCLLLSSPDENS